MRLSAGRHTLQKGGKLGYHDGTSLDGESVKRTRAHLSEDGGIPSAGKSGEESDELEEGELTSNSSGSQHKYGDGSCHRFPRGPSSNPYDYSDGGSSDPGVDSRDSHRRTAESLLRSLPIETRIEYTDQKKLTGVAPISKYKISRKIGEGSFGCVAKEASGTAVHL